MKKEQVQEAHVGLMNCGANLTVTESIHAKAEAAYQDALADWEEDHPELVDARKDAKEAMDTAQAAFMEERNTVKTLLSDYFQQPDADPKPAPAFGVRRDKKPTYHGSKKE